MSYQLIHIFSFRLVEKSAKVLGIPNLLNVNISRCAENRSSWRPLRLLKSLSEKEESNQKCEQEREQEREGERGITNRSVRGVRDDRAEWSVESAWRRMG